MEKGSSKTTYSSGYRRPYKRYDKPKPRPTQKAMVKKMVGEQPSVVEQIANGVGSVAKLASAIMPIVAAINTEEKYLDNTASVTPNLATPTITYLTGMAQGTSDITRIGDSVKAQFLQVRFYITPNFISQNNNLVRIMLIVDKMASASMSIGTPTAAMLFASTSNPFSPINKDNGDRFVILKDKVMALNSPTPTAATSPAHGGDSRILKLNVPLDFHVRYSASAATDFGPNNILLVCWTNLTGTGPSITYYSRFKFTDN